MNLVEFLIVKGEKISPTLEGVYEKMSETIKKTAEFIDEQKFLHYIRPDSGFGAFKIAKQISFSRFNKNNCSIATDGTFLYVFF